MKKQECIKCGKSRHISNFGVNRLGQRSEVCLHCKVKIENAFNKLSESDLKREVKNAKQREYRRANPEMRERQNVQARARKAKNKDKTSEYNKKYYADNKEKQQQRGRDCYHKNREKNIARNRRWKADNRETYLVNRRASDKAYREKKKAERAALLADETS